MYDAHLERTYGRRTLLGDRLPYAIGPSSCLQCYFSCCFLVSVSVKVLDHKFFQLLLSFSYFFSVSISVTIMIFLVSVPVLVVNVGNVIISYH